jgi:hypothetical protein
MSDKMNDISHKFSIAPMMEWIDLGEVVIAAQAHY